MINFQWHDVKTPLFICLWMVFILVVKLVFHSNSKALKMPDSSMLIIAGFCVGTCLDWFFPHDVYMDPDLFFLYLLPPIALEAGYFMPNRLLFQNIGTILTFAVVGTCWNILTIGGTLWLFSGFFSMEIELVDLFLFSTLISAVDPVAVLSVFTEVKVNELLYIMVFGESLLNDAVTIVLYHALSSMAMIGSDHLESKDFLRASGAFFLVTIGGVLFGVLGAAFTGIATKMTKNLEYTQPLICLLFPYIAYLLSELAHYSGILAIVICGLFMKPYVRHNLNSHSLTTVKYFLKTIANHSEAMIFIFLGLSTFSRNHTWDYYFIGVTLVSCFLYRFIGIYILSFICNLKRMEKIGLVDQFIMAYGGLRGAICYGLVMSLDDETIKAKDMFTTTSVVVIIFTVFLQGSSIGPLVKFLQVKKQEERVQTMTDILVSSAQNDVMAGIEAIVGIHGQYFWRRRMSQFDREFVQPVITSKTSSRAQDLVNKYSTLALRSQKSELIKGLNAELQGEE